MEKIPQANNEKLGLVKAIMSGNSDEVAKGRKKLISKFISTAIIFVVAAVTQFVFVTVSTPDTEDGNTVVDCIACYLYGKCEESSYLGKIEQERHDRLDEIEKYEQGLDPVSSNENSNNNSNSNSNNTKVNGTIFVGDSRTVGMCGYGDNALYKGSACRIHTVIAQQGKGYDWFNSDAIKYVNEIINKDTSKKYNIVILMGVNDVGNSDTLASSAVTKYSNTISSKARTDWKNHNVVFVSIPPIDGSKTTFVGASQVDKFNSGIKDSISKMRLSNVKYCDITKDFDVTSSIAADGIHYNSDGYVKLYNKVTSTCL